MVISDIVLSKELPPEVLKSVEAYVGCVAGAMKRDAYLEAILEAGFEKVDVISENSYGDVFTQEDERLQAFAREMQVDPATATDWASSVMSIKVRAVK